MYISLYDLGLIILFCLALVAGYYLIVTLRAILAVTRTIAAIIDSRRSALEKSIELLPEILNNTNEAIVAVKTTAEPVSSLARYLESNLTETADNFERLAETVLLYARWAAEIIKQVMALLSKKGDK
ncbi:conserved hypothetical protein [Thermosinus carboxydivorans Nor1]|uniref:DUF948 domain-containing protein n=1 Tax=Thermosinus carboxydivorans Nor1 TaxID=401526 RepID=A1HQ31_9FIRM|nr:hypothetical protein [Thermosinus carboxydivorans]EAX47880.1 conserved hypothetical protein [Thermosinus carboxydivorans Nor1]